MSDAMSLSVGGAPEGFDARLVLGEVEKTQGPVIHVARDDTRMAQMAEALRALAPDLSVSVSMIASRPMPISRPPEWRP